MKTGFQRMIKFKKARLPFALILFLFFCKNISFAQYIPIPTDTTAIWRVDWYDYNFCGPNQPNASYQYYFNGDTTISNVIYSKLFTSGYSQCFPLGFIGSFRNDSLNQKAYFIEADSTAEKLIYDFNPTIGDTVPQLLQGSSITVTFIDTVFIDGVSRKRIWHDFLYPPLGPYIIEGIGTTNGLLAPINGLETVYNLICFSHENRLIFPDTATICSMYENIDNVNLSHEVVYPNPLRDKTTVTSSMKMEQIELRNIEGIEVLNAKVNSNTFLIDCDRIQAGIYILKIKYARNFFKYLKIIKL